MHRAKFGPCMAHLGLLRAHRGFDARNVRAQIRDDPGASTDLAHLAGAIQRHHLDFSLEATLLDGGLRAQLVALGEDLRHG